MIVASLLLVIAAAVTLLVGLLNREVIEWVWASIACCLLAGLLLTIGVPRSRPSRKPVLQSGGEGQQASWAGASQWGGSGTDSSAAVLTRDPEDDVDEPTVRVTSPADDELTGDDEPTRTSLPTAEAAADEGSPWAPVDQGDVDTGELSDVRVVPPPPPPPPFDVPAETADAADSDDVVVVPKPSARADGDVLPPPPPRDEDSGMAAGQAAAAAAAAETPTTAADEAARFEQVLSPIAGVGPAKRKALLDQFGTYRKLRAATPEKLAETPGISRTLADRIHTALHR
jgi:hypothetical protein